MSVPHIAPSGIREGYIILQDHGRKLGMSFRERDVVGINDRAELIKDVADGQFEGPDSRFPVQVVHLNADGTWVDCTAEIVAEARDVAADVWAAE